MDTFEELATRVGRLAFDAGLLETSLHDVSLHSDNAPEFAIAMWLERLNRGGVQLPTEIVTEITDWLMPDQNEDDQDVDELLAENQALAS